MNWVDAILLLVFLIAVWIGWQRGFILGTIDLINWIGSVLLGFLFYPYTAKFLNWIFPALGVWLLPLAFILTIIFARILIGIVTGRIAWATTDNVHESATNRFFGIIPGAINGFIYATIVAALLLSLPLLDNITQATRNSRIASRLTNQVEWVNEKLSPVFDKAINQTINQLTIHPGSSESVKLPFTDKNPTVRPDLEAEMLSLVNQERI